MAEETNTEETEKPLHAAAPETVDTAKEREEQDKIRQQQADLLKKQDDERRSKQNADDRKKQDGKDAKGAARFK